MYIFAGISISFYDLWDKNLEGVLLCSNGVTFLNLILFFSRHGYERWHDIAEDKDLNLQKVICQELNIPVLQSDVTNVQSSCPPSGENVRSDIAADGANMTNVESSFTKSKKSVSRGSSHRRKQVQAFRKSVVGHDYKQIQKAQTEFIKKRFRLLEKGLNAECQKEYYVSALDSIVLNFYFITQIFSHWNSWIYGQNVS